MQVIDKDQIKSELGVKARKLGLTVDQTPDGLTIIDDDEPIYHLDTARELGYSLMAGNMPIPPLKSSNISLP